MGGHFGRYNRVVIAVKLAGSRGIKIKLTAHSENHVVAGDIETPQVHDGRRAAYPVKRRAIRIGFSSDLPGVINPLPNRHLA